MIIINLNINKNNLLYQKISKQFDFNFFQLKINFVIICEI